MKILILCIFLLTPTLTEAAVLNRAPNNLGLVGYWPMNEGSGTKAGDMSGNKNHGTISGATWTSGKLSKALSFNGSNSLVTTPLVLSNSNPFTFSVWVKFATDGATDSKIIFSQDSTGNDDISLTYSNGIISYESETDVHSADQSTGFEAITIEDNDWHHIVVVEKYTTDVDDNDYYIDGVKMVTDNNTGAGNPANTTLVIGNRGEANNAWSGSLDDARLYNRALTAAQVSALYKAGSVRVGASSADLDDGSTLENGLVGHWTLDGKDTNWATGKANDLSGNGNHGNISGMSTTSSPTIGKLGQALKFDGVDDKIVVPYNSSLAPSEITISLWIRPSDSGVVKRVIDRNTTAYIIRRSANQTMQFVPGFYNTTGTVPQDQWSHFVVSASSAGHRMYINGVLDFSNTVAYSPSGTSDLGIPSNNLDFFGGLLDDVRIYNRALTANEIAQLYKLGGDKVNASSADLDKGSSLESGMVGHWTFDGKNTNWGTNKTNDLSGNANHGTMTNMSTTSSPTIGKLGQALKFDGVDDYVDAGSASSLDNIETQGGGGMSVAFWTKPFSNATKMFISKGLASNGNGNWSIKKDATTDPARLNFTKEGATDMSTNWNSFFTTGVWTHVVVTWDGSMDVSGVKAYKNGVLDGQDFSISGATGNSDASNNLHIGSGNGASFADADMDEVRIYNRVLTASEVKQLYKMGR